MPIASTKNLTLSPRITALSDICNRIVPVIGFCFAGLLRRFATRNDERLAIGYHRPTFKQNRTFGIVMFESVIKAKHIKNYRVWIAFDDGKEGEIDLAQKLKGRSGVFTPLQNVNYFKNFKIENDTLSWENGADIAPESLYELLTQQNQKD